MSPRWQPPARIKLGAASRGWAMLAGAVRLDRRALRVFEWRPHEEKRE